MTAEATPPTSPKTKKRPGPRPRKGTDAALALRDLYESGASDDRKMIRMIVEIGCGHTVLRMIAAAVENLDEAGYDLAADLFDVVDKRSEA